MDILNLVNSIKGNPDPKAMLNNMMSNDPDYQKVMQMTHGKNSNEMKILAENICRQRGINLEDFIKSLGLR